MYIMSTQPTLLETFLISLTVSVFTSIIIPLFISRYLNTYTNFRKYLIETRMHLRLYVNIYTNNWYVGQVNSSFEKEIKEIKDALRVIWVHVENSYLLIPPMNRWILERMGWLPDREELDCILGKLLGIHNSTIIYRSEHEKETYGSKELTRRYDMIKEVNEFLNRYIQ